jgi:hypothetical protein
LLSFVTINKIDYNFDYKIQYSLSKNSLKNFKVDK